MPSAPIRIRPGEDGRLIVQFPYSPDHVAKIKTMECLRLRVQDIDFSRNEIFVRDGSDDLYACSSSRASGCPQPAGWDVNPSKDGCYADPNKNPC